MIREYVMFAVLVYLLSVHFMFCVARLDDYRPCKWDRGEWACVLCPFINTLYAALVLGFLGWETVTNSLTTEK